MGYLAGLQQHSNRYAWRTTATRASLHTRACPHTLGNQTLLAANITNLLTSPLRAVPSSSAPAHAFAACALGEAGAAAEEASMDGFESMGLPVRCLALVCVIHNVPPSPHHEARSSALSQSYTTSFHPAPRSLNPDSRRCPSPKPDASVSVIHNVLPRTPKPDPLLCFSDTQRPPLNPDP